MVAIILAPRAPDPTAEQNVELCLPLNCSTKSRTAWRSEQSGAVSFTCPRARARPFLSQTGEHDSAWTTLPPKCVLSGGWARRQIPIKVFSAVSS